MLTESSSRRNLRLSSGSFGLSESGARELHGTLSSSYGTFGCLIDPHTLMKRKVRQYCRKQTIFLLFVFIAVVIGVGLGLYLNSGINKHRIVLTQKQLYYLKFPGFIFLRMMTLLVVPLAVCANISSLSSLNLKAAGFMGALTMATFVISNLFAATIGMLLAVMIRPGNFGKTIAEAQKALNETNQDRLDIDETFMGLLLNLIPDNLFVATFEKTKLEIIFNNSDEPRFEPAHQRGANVFGLLCFSIIFGLALQNLGSRGTTTREFFQECRHALLWVVSILIWYFPIGVASLVAAEIARIDDLGGAMMKMTMYVVTMCVGLVIQFCLLNVAFLLITRKSPLKLFYDMVAALTCGMGTASSSATLPVTLKCLRRASYTNINVVRFLLPLGMTLNMNGTAVLESVGPIFLMQCIGLPITVWNALLVIFSAYLATMVTGTMPSGGLMTIIITLDALKVPKSLIALMYPVDWLLDRLRTPLNVYGNAVATGIVSHYLDAREKANESRARPGEQVQINICSHAGLSTIGSSEASYQGNNGQASQTSSDSGYVESREDQEDEEIINQVTVRF